MNNLIFVFVSLLVLTSCQSESEKVNQQPQTLTVSNPAEDSKLSDYWYQGKAEINRYELQQNRYKDTHPGEAVLVFVTEDFLTDKQVKNDNYSNPNSTGILKMNGLRRFTTGLYDYSIMTSVFTPTDVRNQPQTLKVTNSVQDWCGQTWMQINKGERDYKVELRSYFESENDQNFKVDDVILEDELFNRIRMNPTALPEGKMKVLPSATTVRMLHIDFAPVKAVLKSKSYVGTDFEGENLQVYEVQYTDLNRTLEIVFEMKAPYAIVGWKDTRPSVFDKQARSTIAKRTHHTLSPYWSKNGLADTRLRAELGLD
ncbi:MAG: hypothetical protein AB8G22_10135 [Saprospiraceae bacterium]